MLSRRIFHSLGWDYRRKSLRRHCFWPRRKAVTSAASICPSTVAWCRSDSFLSLIPERSETSNCFLIKGSLRGDEGMANRLSSNDISTLYEKISNWGRWGKEDERGALNFITDAKRAAAGDRRGAGQSHTGHASDGRDRVRIAYDAGAVGGRLFRNCTARNGEYASGCTLPHVP